jgi:transposase-like protein
VESATAKDRRQRKRRKQVVVAINQREGELRFFHAENAKSGTLVKYIKEKLSGDVKVVITDA